MTEVQMPHVHPLPWKLQEGQFGVKRWTLKQKLSLSGSEQRPSPLASSPMKVLSINGMSSIFDLPLLVKPWEPKKQVPCLLLSSHTTQEHMLCPDSPAHPSHIVTSASLEPRQQSQASHPFRAGLSLKKTQRVNRQTSRLSYWSCSSSFVLSVS